MRRTVLQHFMLGSLLFAGTSIASSAIPEDLTELSLEALLDIEVTSVSRRSEQLATSAASVFVLTNEEIRRSGARTLPEALKLVPGLHVAQIDGQRWAIAARGFNGNISDKLEVLIDGRSVYSPLYAGTFWDSQDVFLPDIDRIEVIRGPASVTWGSNAVNGVINIVTRDAAQTQGALVYAGGGNEQEAFAGARYGGTLGDNAHWRAYTRYWQRDPLVTSAGERAEDGMDMTQTGFRVDWAGTDGHRLTVQGNHYENRLDFPASDFFNPEGKDNRQRGSNLLARWEHRLNEDSQWTLQAYWDRTDRVQQGIFGELRNTWDLQLTYQTSWWERNEVVIGGGYRASRDEQENPPIIQFIPAKRTVQNANVFINNQYSLSDRTVLTMGARLEDNEFTGFDVQPSVRFSHALNDRTVFWGSVSRALRLPTRLDEDVIVASVIGNKDFEPEELIGQELGFRHLLSRNLSVDGTVFRNDYDKIRGTEEAQNGEPGLIVNNHSVTSHGAELSAMWQASDTLKLHGAYSFITLDFRPDAGTTDTTTENSEDLAPRHQVWLRAEWQPVSRLSIGSYVRFVDEIRGSKVPAFTELNLRLGWQLNRAWEIALTGQNLAEAQHREWVEPDADSEAQRGVYAELIWHPGAQ